MSFQADSTTRNKIIKIQYTFVLCYCLNCLCQCTSDKLSLVGMQLPDNKENFDVSSEGPSSGVNSQI
jgi:hypothetical protein